MGRQLKLRVRVGSIYLIEDIWYGAGDEFTLPDEQAALILRDKTGRRGVEIVEVIDDRAAGEQPAKRKLP